MLADAKLDAQNAPENEQKKAHRKRRPSHHGREHEGVGQLAGLKDAAQTQAEEQAQPKTGGVETIAGLGVEETIEL